MIYSQPVLNNIELNLHKILFSWGFTSSAQLELLTVSENATYVAKEPGLQCIIRVYRPNYHSKKEILSELMWLQAINQSADVIVPQPLMTKAGELIVEFEQNLRAVAFEFLEGQEPSLGSSVTPWFEVLGELTAKLHTHAQQWHVPSHFARKYWDLNTMVSPNGYWGDWRKHPGFRQKKGINCVESALNLLAKRLQEYGKPKERYGLVHADLRLANLLVNGDALQIIDFDDCGYCWYGYDFAAAISFYETDPINPKLQHAWLNGYRKVREFSTVDEAEMASFILLRRVLLTAWLASHAETATAEEFGPGFSLGTERISQQYLDSGGASVWLEDE